MNPQSIDGHFAKPWQQTGKVWLWRYHSNVRNYPGWQLTADAHGAHSLLLLFDTLDFGGGAAFRTITISASSAPILSVPNNRNALWKAPQKLRLAATSHREAWALTGDAEMASPTIGRDWVPGLRAAIAGINARRGDVSVGPPEKHQKLWIWWCNGCRDSM